MNFLLAFYNLMLYSVIYGILTIWECMFSSTALVFQTSFFLKQNNLLLVFLLITYVVIQ